MFLLRRKQWSSAHILERGALWVVIWLVIWVSGCAPAAVAPQEDAPAIAASPIPMQSPIVPAPTPAPTARPSRPSPTKTAVPTMAPTPTPEPPAQLVATFPIDGDEGVPLDAPLVLCFSRPADAEWIRSHLMVSPTVHGEISMRDSTVAEFRPAGLWSADTRYTVRWNGSGGDPVEVHFATFPDGRVPLPILMYHRLADLPADAGPSTREWTTSPADFRAHMRYLRDAGYHAVSLDAVLDYLQFHAPLPPKPVVLTFDDGYRDVAEVAWPVLRELGMPATIFIIPGHVGYGAFLTWDQLIALVEDGAAVGSHTLDHVRLKGAEEGEMRRQLQESRRKLEKRLGVPVMAISYPYGAYDVQVVQAAGEAGYRAGVTINPSRYQQRSGVFALSRLHLPYQAGVESFAELLGP